MDYVLQTKEVSKDFSGKLAVNHVSIGVKKGDIYGFIGENGAGKTTFMRMVCGLAEPTGGEITLFGSKDLVSQRHRVGCTFENPALFPETGNECMAVRDSSGGMAVAYGDCFRNCDSFYLIKDEKSSINLWY